MFQTHINTSTHFTTLKQNTHFNNHTLNPLSPPLPKRYILTAARLITPQLDKKDWSLGFQWAIDSLKPDHDAIASELEIDMSLMHLKRREFEKAIDMLKMFEKKDQEHRTMAATNLSFIYFLEQDFNQVCLGCVCV